MEMLMELMFPLVRNLSKKTHSDFIIPHGSIQIHSFDPPSLSHSSSKRALRPPNINGHLQLGKKTTSGITSSFLYRNQLLGPEKVEGEMAATSGAVLNGLGSSFLCGGKRSQALLSLGASRIGSCSVGTRKLVVVAAAAAQPKKSWIPAVKGGGNFLDPEWLDGSLPGDYGFDPLGLGKDPAFLKWYREAELIHGRWAMAAVVGIFVGQAWSGIPWFEAGADPGAIAPFSFGSLLGTQLLLMGWVESKRWVDFFNPESQSVEWATPWSKTAENFANATGDQGYPGGKFFDPLGFAGILKDGVYIPDDEKLQRLKVAEIKHARLAMVAMLIFYFEAGQGKTPLGALGL